MKPVPSMTPRPVCGNLHILRHLSIYSRYWRSILAVYFGVYGRVLQSIRPYTRITGTFSLPTMPPFSSTINTPPPPCNYCTSYFRPYCNFLSCELCCTTED